MTYGIQDQEEMVLVVVQSDQLLWACELGGKKARVVPRG